MAVVVIGEGDDEHELVVPRSQLPRHSREGHWLKVEVADGQIVVAETDEAATEAARQRIAEKLERLRRGDHLK